MNSEIQLRSSDQNSEEVDMNRQAIADAQAALTLAHNLYLQAEQACSDDPSDDYAAAALLEADQAYADASARAEGGAA